MTVIEPETFSHVDSEKIEILRQRTILVQKAWVVGGESRLLSYPHPTFLSLKDIVSTGKSSFHLLSHLLSLSRVLLKCSHP